MSVEGIPPTDWQYDTDEASSWAWKQSDDSDATVDTAVVSRDVAIYTVVQCKEAGVSTRETAEFVPFSKSWVANRWQEYRDDDEHRQLVDKVEREIA
jgi:hypothetical protein